MAADTWIRATIQSGGLTPERTVALDAAEIRLHSARFVLNAAEDNVRDIAVAAMIDCVGPEDAALEWQD